MWVPWNTPPPPLGTNGPGKYLSVNGQFGAYQSVRKQEIKPTLWPGLWLHLSEPKSTRMLYISPGGGGEGGALNFFFFGEHVSRRFPKVGSRERVFLEKGEVLGAKFRKFCLFRAEI